MNRDRVLDAYFKNAASWDRDRAAQVRRSATLGWRVAAAGWICAVTSAAALVLLMPLKRVEPFVVRVDNRTGIVDVVPMYAGEVEMDEAVTRYFLVHYVSVCERFNLASAQSDYEECGAFHSSQRNQQWYEFWKTSNPDSPLNVHKDGSIMRVQVESVNFFDRSGGVSNLAQVRYRKARRQAVGAEESSTYWIATIRYAYAAVSKDPKVRRWNPLGFKIVEFAVEQEALAQARAMSSEASQGQFDEK